MISASNICLAYGKRTIFKNVNIKFTPGNCYGLIGANGAGKSTFLKILAGDSDPDKGEVSIAKGLRMAVLRQDQFAFDEETVFNTVIMGHERLFSVMAEREAIYSKGEFTEEGDVVRALPGARGRALRGAVGARRPGAALRAAPHGRGRLPRPDV